MASVSGSTRTRRVASSCSASAWPLLIPSAIISSPVTADMTSSVSDAAPGTRPPKARKARVSRVTRSAIATTRRSRFASAAASARASARSSSTSGLQALGDQQPVTVTAAVIRWLADLEATPQPPQTARNPLPKESFPVPGREPSSLQLAARSAVEPARV